MDESWDHLRQGVGQGSVRPGRPAVGQMDGMGAIVADANLRTGTGHSHGSGNRGLLHPQPVPKQIVREPQKTATDISNAKGDVVVVGYVLRKANEAWS